MSTSTLRFHGSILHGNKTGGKRVVTETRELTFRFYQHLHPFTRELDDRLIRESFDGLQAIDTEYATAVKLDVETTVSSLAMPGVAARTNKLPKGAVVRLLDGTRIETDGVKAVLRGLAVVNEADQSRVRMKRSQSLTLRANTVVENADGEQVRLTAQTTATLPAGRSHPRLFEETFAERYKPAPPPPADGSVKPGVFVDARHPARELDFSSEGAYSVYNWELFCHSLWLVAVHHSRNKNFEAAESCFRLLFDPTDSSEGATPERFWKVLPFQTTETRQMEDIFTNLATNADSDLAASTISSIEAWKKAPFKPFLIARFRPQAFKIGVLMAYFDHKIAWGDHLFRTDNPENIERARLEYITVANLLGQRPQPVPRKGSAAPMTYARMKDHVKQFGVALEQLESDLPFDLAPPPPASAPGAQSRVLGSIGRGLYFCLPRNDKLLGYWDIIADRLFKIRNSLNLAGVFRRLPLFPPPIDPELLARASAAGLDVAAIASGLNQPLPQVRFQMLLQKALELCQEVKSLGGQLLSVIEKQDNEALAVLRAKHEGVMLQHMTAVKHQQANEARAQVAALNVSLANATQRYHYYEGQFGVELKDCEAKVKDAQSKGFGEYFRPLIPDIAAGDITQGRLMSSHEKMEMEKLDEAFIQQQGAALLEAASAVFHLFPTLDVDGKPLGVGAGAGFGGQNLGAASSALASVSRFFANINVHEATTAAKIGGYWRREQEWAFQSNLALGEIELIHAQLIAAAIREQIASIEATNHQRQIKHAQEIEDFLTLESFTDPDGREQKGRTANSGFYAWMRREVQGLYSQCYDFAFEIAKKAERALQHELGDFSLTFIRHDHRAGPEGLLAGEKLHLELKRMDQAWIELNTRELEITKHVSLARLDPAAILKLKRDGLCVVTVPEWLFDMDYPGHYFRRIKNVAISIPGARGPYASVNSTLSLTSSVVRVKPVAAEGEDDEVNLSRDFTRAQSIVTSTGINDSGMFETNLRDERPLPFEGAGAVSTWTIEMRREDNRQIDFDSITDVVLHLRYTARSGGGVFQQMRRDAVKKWWKEGVPNPADESHPLPAVRRVFFLHDEFPSEWRRFLEKPADGLSLTDLKQRMPYLWPALGNTIERVALVTLNHGETLPQNVNLLTEDAPGGVPQGTNGVWLGVTWGNKDWKITCAGNPPSALGLIMETHLDKA